MIIVNFKTYEEATGDKAVELAKRCQEAADKIGKEIILVPQTADIYRIASAVRLKIFAQHVDEIDYGSNTGSILIDAVKQAGASGTVINHSENRLPIQKIKDIVEKCKHKNFEVMVCAQDPDEIEQFTRLEPNYVAYEPPELIGGDVSVSTAKPEMITGSKERADLREIPLIVGAGVKTSQDVRISLDLGAKGVFVASGIVKAEDQKKAVIELCSGLP